MPLLWSYAKPPPDKEAGPTPRRFIRHSAKTKKAVPAYWHGTARISRGETQSAYRPHPVKVFVLGGDVEGKGFEIVQRGDALPAEKFSEVGYFDIALARAADMHLVPRFVFRREIVQFLGIFLKTERALDALGPERRPAVRTRMHPLSALVDVPALVARRLRAAQMPDESRAPAYRTVPMLPNVVLRVGPAASSHGSMLLYTRNGSKLGASGASLAHASKGSAFSSM